MMMIAYCLSLSLSLSIRVSLSLYIYIYTYTYTYTYTHKHRHRHRLIMPYLTRDLTGYYAQCIARLINLMVCRQCCSQPLSPPLGSFLALRRLFSWRFEARKRKVKPLRTWQNLSETSLLLIIRRSLLKETTLRGNHVARTGKRITGAAFSLR